MADELKLEVPERVRRAPGRGGGVAALLVLLVILASINIAIEFVGPVAGAPEGAGGVPAERRRDLALKLEKQGLTDAAASAWEEYLSGSDAPPEERAKVHYRLGKLRQEAGDYAGALAAYYRSEADAELSDISGELARRTQECLEAMGRFSALRYELGDRVGLGGDSSPGGDEVVAEIGAEKITRRELDRLAEARVERQLSQLSSILPPEEIARQREAMSRRMSSGAERARILERILSEEVLYRRARETGLADKDETKRLLADMQRQVLASKLMDSEMAGKVEVTPAQMQDYYKAHTDEFTEEKETEDGKKEKVTKPFDEVKGQVYQMLRARRERELQSALIEDLMNRYDVVIHRSRLTGHAEGGEKLENAKVDEK